MEGDRGLWKVWCNLMTDTQTKNLTYSPANMGMQQARVLAEPFVFPQHRTGWIEQDKGKDIRW